MPTARATFGGGCFWCTETVFQALRGVNRVTSGYAGGKTANPTYEQICSGTTGHAEVIQVEFDPAIISYEQLLEVFFLTHDPTTVNRQGHDVGEQYRSIIFYHDGAQRETAARIKNRVQHDGIYPGPLVTEIVPFTAFSPAEAYHQNYFAKNPDQPYCQAVINPKIAAFRQKFSRLLKPGAGRPA